MPPRVATSRYEPILELPPHAPEQYEALVAGLDHGASKAIGIDEEARYVEISRRRIRHGRGDGYR